MAKLTVVPDQSSYSIEFHNDILAVKLDGGRTRYRRDYIGDSTHNVTLRWILDPTGYNDLLSFYTTTIDNGTDPFSIDLIVNSTTLTEFDVHLVPNSFKLISQSGLTYIVGAELEILGLTA